MADQPYSMKLVQFHGDTLFAVERQDGVFVAIKPICDSIGLAWRKQQKRLTTDPILSEGITVAVMPTAGGAQETTLLRFELINGWLFTVDVSRVKEEARPILLTYQRECYPALFAHFYGKATGAPFGGAERPRTYLDWTVEERNSHNKTVELYCRSHGPAAAQWIMRQIGYPIVPPELTYLGRQLDLLDAIIDGPAQ